MCTIMNYTKYSYIFDKKKKKILIFFEDIKTSMIIISSLTFAKHLIIITLNCFQYLYLFIVVKLHKETRTKVVHKVVIRSKYLRVRKPHNLSIAYFI